MLLLRCWGHGLETYTITWLYLINAPGDFFKQINKPTPAGFTPEQLRRLQEEAAADNVQVTMPGVRF